MHQGRAPEVKARKKGGGQWGGGGAATERPALVAKGFGAAVTMVPGVEAVEFLGGAENFFSLLSVSLTLPEIQEAV